MLVKLYMMLVFGILASAGVILYGRSMGKHMCLLIADHSKGAEHVKHFNNLYLLLFVFSVGYIIFAGITLIGSQLLIIQYGVDKHISIWVLVLFLIVLIWSYGRFLLPAFFPRVQEAQEFTHT
jgi:hypothetical protein